MCSLFQKKKRNSTCIVLSLLAYIILCKGNLFVSLLIKLYFEARGRESCSISLSLCYSISNPGTGYRQRLVIHEFCFTLYEWLVSTCTGSNCSVRVHLASA